MVLLLLIIKMISLPLFLIIFFFFSLILNYISFSEKKTAIEIVNDMGIGYNLGYSFDCYDDSKEIKNPDEQITLLGNSIPTKKLINNIKKYGFKTIRLPVTWIYFLDKFGNIDSEWMSRVKEVVEWIIENNMYCILNIYNDGLPGNWLSNGINAREKFINLWKQIGEEFKDFNEYLIFESMNRVSYYYRNNFDYLFDYSTLLNFTQSFVDIIRNSGGYNNERLLLISGANNHLQLTCFGSYKMPIDPSNKLAISIHYYVPDGFTSVPYENDFGYLEKWGNDVNYNELIYNFEVMKNFFVNKGIPVILGEIGVLTEEKEKKDIVSIREFLYVVFSISSELNGIMPCLWDTSNKKFGDMNYYNRDINEWYDEKIKENFNEISKGHFIKTSEFYIKTYSQTVKTTDRFGDMLINLVDKKALKLILNVKIKGVLFFDSRFTIYSVNKEGELFSIVFNKENGKKQYDGTYIFTIDISNEDCNEYIEIIKWYGSELIFFNNLTVEYNESFLSFDYKDYKSAISNKVK